MVSQEKYVEWIKENEIPIVEIDPNRDYWLVRTNGGEYFQDFLLGNYIGVNWNEFDNSERFLERNRKHTTEMIADAYPKNKQPGHTFTHMKRFFHEIKIGDIVMIPSEDSKQIAFGEVISDVYTSEMSQTDIDEGECPYKKRKKVTWTTTVERRKLDPYLYRMMNSHLTISNAGDYADAIDRTMYSFYYKGDKAHLVLNVNQQKDIPLIDLVETLSAPLDLVDYVQDPLEISRSFNKRDLDAKLRVQSQGVIEFVSSGSAFLLPVIIGLIIVGFVGGKAHYKKTKDTTEAGIESDGILGKVMQFVKHKDEKDLKEKEMDSKLTEIKDNVENASEKLKIETPEELSDYFSDENTQESNKHEEEE